MNGHRPGAILRRSVPSWILFFAVALAALSAIFYLAGGIAFHGSNWATNLCWHVRFFCDTPEALAIAVAFVTRNRH